MLWIIWTVVWWLCLPLTQWVEHKAKFNHAGDGGLVQGGAWFIVWIIGMIKFWNL